MKYQYSLVRFVPDPARGEAVNLGAIVGSDATREWDMRLVSSRRRAICLDDAHAMPGVAEILARIESDVEGADDELLTSVSEAWLRTLADEHQHVLQFSAPTPMIAPSPEDALDLIFANLVVDPGKAERSFRTKHRALAATRIAYRDARLEPNVVAEKPVVRAAGYVGKLDFVVHNARAVQCTQSWSFELPNQEDLSEEVHSWAWMAEAIRRGDGEATLADGHRITLPKDVEFGVVYIPPRGDQRASAFPDAQQAFRDLKVTAVPWDRASELAARAALSLGHR